MLHTNAYQVYISLFFTTNTIWSPIYYGGPSHYKSRACVCGKQNGPNTATQKSTNSNSGDATRKNMRTFTKKKRCTSYVYVVRLQFVFLPTHGHPAHSAPSVRAVSSPSRDTSSGHRKMVGLGPVAPASTVCTGCVRCQYTGSESLVGGALPEAIFYAIWHH